MIRCELVYLQNVKANEKSVLFLLIIYLLLCLKSEQFKVCSLIWKITKPECNAKTISFLYMVSHGKSFYEIVQTETGKHGEYLLIDVGLRHLVWRVFQAQLQTKQRQKDPQFSR